MKRDARRPGADMQRRCGSVPGSLHHVWFSPRSNLPGPANQRGLVFLDPVVGLTSGGGALVGSLYFLRRAAGGGGDSSVARNRFARSSSDLRRSPISV